MARSVAGEAGSSPMQARQSFTAIQRVLGDKLFKSAGIAIATTTTKVKTASAVYAMINGALVAKAATDNFWTLSGTVTNAKNNVYVLCMDASGNAAAFMGTEASTIAGIVWPVVPDGYVVFGFVFVNPSGTGNFIGGTTALSDGTVVPNAVYIDTPFAFNPQAILTLPN